MTLSHDPITFIVNAHDLNPGLTEDARHKAIRLRAFRMARAGGWEPKEMTSLVVMRSGRLQRDADFDLHWRVTLEVTMRTWDWDDPA
jgi:hypothetical protein